jgi:hypothetical protein
MEGRQRRAGEGPLILLTDPLSFSDNKALADWLASHEVVSYRAADPIDAIGYLSDFTLSTFPDLITIPRGDEDDAGSVSVLIKSLIEADYFFSVFQYSEESNGRRFISLAEIDHWLSDRGTREGT